MSKEMQESKRNRCCSSRPLLEPMILLKLLYWELGVVVVVVVVIVEVVAVVVVVVSDVGVVGVVVVVAAV